MEENNFLAVLMSSDEDVEFWFKTQKDAWDFIYSRSCQSCKESDVDMCAAEWDVWTREEYIKYRS